MSEQKVKIKQVVTVVLKSVVTIFFVAFIVLACARRFNATAHPVLSGGIEKKGAVMLGGTPQYVSMSGDDVSNPVVIFLHGGPGLPMSAVSYVYRDELKRDFTWVDWDQRGCGRTFSYTGKDENLSIEKLVSDLDELVTYVLDQTGRDKVIIMGHCFGSLLGTRYVTAHPERVEAYVGVCQFVNGPKSYTITATKAREEALRRGENEDAERLWSAYLKVGEAKTTAELDKKAWNDVAALMDEYAGCKNAYPAARFLWTGLTSPDLSLSDLKWYMTWSDTEKVMVLERSVMDYVICDTDLSAEKIEFAVPAYFIEAESDVITDTSLAEEYACLNVTAPVKKFVVVENAGHTVMFDNPEGFIKAVREVLS